MSETAKKWILAILMAMMPLFYLLLTKSLGDLQRNMMVLLDFFA